MSLGANFWAQRPESINSRRRAKAMAEVAFTLFEYCDTGYDSVCNLRLVCKSWRELIDPLWRSYRVPLKIHERFFCSDSYNCIVGAQIRNFSDFVEQHQNALYKDAHRNLFLDLDLSRYQILPIERVVEFVAKPVLWTAYLQNIAVLELVGTGVPVSKCKFDPEFSGSLPNLERLTIKTSILIFRHNYIPKWLRQPQVKKPAENNIAPRKEAQAAVWTKLKFMHLENVKFEDRSQHPSPKRREKLIMVYPNLGKVIFPPQLEFTFTTESSKRNNVWVLEGPLKWNP